MTLVGLVFIGLMFRGGLRKSVRRICILIFCAMIYNSAISEVIENFIGSSLDVVTISKTGTMVFGIAFVVIGCIAKMREQGKNRLVGLLFVLLALFGFLLYRSLTNLATAIIWNFINPINIPFFLGLTIGELYVGVLISLVIGLYYIISG